MQEMYYSAGGPHTIADAATDFSSPVISARLCITYIMLHASLLCSVQNRECAIDQFACRCRMRDSDAAKIAAKVRSSARPGQTQPKF